ncbi:uncharacterized protein LOC134278416 [Saccostrea cucullata]|uniref:uncharacterized protein LOC134278416 n=1 Tax=Saccostrea cuccullata TaxID=36930 RepID=UPI002ED5C6E9
MPGNGPKYYPCCLCKRRTVPSERIGIKKDYVRLLARRFLVSVEDGDVLCSKCRLKCYKEEKKMKSHLKHTRVEQTHDEYEPPTKQTKIRNQPPSSPPSVSLELPTTKNNFEPIGVPYHAYCFICKRPGPKIIVVPPHLRLDAFIRKGIVVPAGVRCCPVHIDADHFTQDALEKITPLSEEVALSRTSIKDLLENSRNFVIDRTKHRLDFDHRQALSDEDYVTLTGLSKSEFDEIMSYINDQDLRETATRSIRTCVAILLVKLRCGLSNKFIATLFTMKKHQIYFVLPT